MGESLGELYVDLNLKKGSFDRDISKAKTDLRGFGSSVPYVTSGLASAGVALAAFGAGAALAAGGLSKEMVGLASDAEEIGSKFDAVFKDSSADARAWADEFSDSVGRSVYDVQKQLSQFQDTFVPLGFSRTEGAEMSKTLTQLTADIASFNNEQDDITAAAIQSALVGNHETMRRYGVIITQTTLNQELLNMGIEKGMQGATEQQKVQARLNMIIAGTADAQGDAVRTGQQYANMQRNIKGDIKDMMTEAGKPALANLNETLKDIDTWGEAGGYERLGNAFKATADGAAWTVDKGATIGMFWTDVFDQAAAAVNEYGGALIEADKAIIQSLRSGIGDGFSPFGSSAISPEFLSYLAQIGSESTVLLDTEKDVSAEKDGQNNALDEQLAKIQAIKEELQETNSSIPDWAGHSDYIKDRLATVNEGLDEKDPNYIHNLGGNDTGGLLDLIEDDPGRLLQGTSREGEVVPTEITQDIAVEITMNIETVRTGGMDEFSGFMSDELIHALETGLGSSPQVRK